MVCEQNRYNFTKQSPRTKPLLGASHFHAAHTPQMGRNYYPHPTDEATEAQRVK